MKRMRDFVCLLAYGQLATELEWGTEAQIKNQNQFHQLLELHLAPATWSDYDRYCHKASVHDMVFRGIKLFVRHNAYHLVMT